MWRLSVLLVVGAIVAVFAQDFGTPRNSNELVDNVLQSCVDTSCVKYNVLKYLDHVLHMETDARSIKVRLCAGIFLDLCKLWNFLEYR